MTLVLKDLAFLEKHLEDTVEIFLKREHKEKEGVEKLNEPRRSEILYLQGVMAGLKAQAEKDKPKDLTPYVEIYYGAMYAIKHHMTANLGYLESLNLLDKRLSDAIGEGGPDNYQYNRFYSSLNSFLKLIFNDKDSRNGLVRPLDLSPNEFARIPFKKILPSLINTSYILEEQNRNRITATYLGDGANEVSSDDYHAPQNIPDSAISNFENFDALKLTLEKLILEELAIKNKATVRELADENRIRQLETLQVIADKLAATKSSAISDKEKRGILTGFMLLAREEIGVVEYKYSEFSPTPIPRSTVHTGLTEKLKLNELSREDAEALIHSAKNFFTFMTIEQKVKEDLIQESVRTKHMFSAVKDFSVVPILELMHRLTKAARIDALDRCVVTYNKELEASLPPKPTALSSAYQGVLAVSGWLGKGKSKARSSEDNIIFDEDEEYTKDSGHGNTEKTLNS